MTAFDRMAVLRTGNRNISLQPNIWLASLLGTHRQDGTASDQPIADSFGWAPYLAMISGAALVYAAWVATASRFGNHWAVPMLYTAIAVIFLPSAGRTIYPGTSRLERMSLVVLTTAALFVIRIIRAPIAFIDHDEFLHWRTAIDILDTGHLFTPNALLPVSPLYPGLEIAATALVNISGLSVFSAGLIVLASARLALIIALFLFFERICQSTRIAAIACLVFMGSSTFVLFDLHFSYESLAIPLLALALLASVDERLEGRHPGRFIAVIILPVLIGLSLTHHLTSFLAAGILGSAACAEFLRKQASLNEKISAVVVGGLAIAIPFCWSKLIGDPTGNYLGPVLASGAREAMQLVQRSGRTLFVSDSGVVAPIWQRYFTMVGVAMVCLGLLTGFLRALSLNGSRGSPRGFLDLLVQRRWQSSTLLILTLMTLAYPFSIILRLTRTGWEMGNRIGSLSFFGVAIVVAIAIYGFWQSRSSSPSRQILIAICLTVIVFAGVISSEGPRIIVPETYEVSADSSSVEPMGISAANWTRTWLGQGHLFATDRINRLLLSTYGYQSVATTLQNWRDTSEAILSATLGPSERKILRDSAIEYVLVDLRITMGLPVIGVYFDGGASDRNYKTPPKAPALLKFNTDPAVDRVFDDGYIVMFDVRRLADD